MDKLRVAFVMDDDSKEITALFPDEVADVYGRYKTCYAHMGQHSSYSDDWAATQSNARPDEYAKLLRELEYVGYDNLVVVPYWGDMFPSCVRLYPGS